MKLRVMFQVMQLVGDKHNSNSVVSEVRAPESNMRVVRASIVGPLWDRLKCTEWLKEERNDVHIYWKQRASLLGTCAELSCSLRIAGRETGEGRGAHGKSRSWWNLDSCFKREWTERTNQNAVIL